MGGAVLLGHLRPAPARRRRPRRTSLAGWVMLVAILFAPATRIGYLLYPIDFFVWSVMLRQADERELLPADALVLSGQPA